MADTPPTGHIGNFLTKQTAGLPNWAWLLVLVAGGGIGFFIVRSQQNTSSSTGTGSGTSSSNQTVPAVGGSPVYVVATSPATTSTTSTPTTPSSPVTTTGTDTGSSGAGSAGTSGNAGGSGTLQGTPILGKPIPTPPYQASGQIRAKGTNPGYDAGNTGVPFNDPSGNNIGYVPFSTLLNVLSPTTTLINGENAYQVSYHGQTGYVNADDIGNITPQTNSGGGRFPPVYYHPAWEAAGVALARMGGAG